MVYANIKKRAGAAHGSIVAARAQEPGAQNASSVGKHEGNLRQLEMIKSAATGALILNRWTRHRPKGAEHAAIAFDRLHAMAAAFAIVDVETCVCRHRLKRFVTAGGTSDDREQFHRSPPCVRSQWQVKSCSCSRLNRTKAQNRECVFQRQVARSSP